MGLPALPDRLLTGDQHHRHGAKKSVGGRGEEVKRTWTKRAQRDPGLAGEPSIGRGQKSRRLLMTGDHQLDGGPAKTFDDGEVLLPGYPEDSINALILQRRNEKIRSLHFTSLL